MWFDIAEINKGFPEKIVWMEACIAPKPGYITGAFTDVQVTSAEIIRSNIKGNRAVGTVIYIFCQLASHVFTKQHWPMNG